MKRNVSLHADNLAAVRTSHGYTQRQLAALIGVSQPYIAQVEAGARPMPDTLRDKVTTALALTPEKMAQIEAIRSQLDEFRSQYGT